MFNFNVFNRPEPETIYLCKPDGNLVCELNGIDEDSAKMTVTMNNQYELEFDYDRFINTLDGTEVESNGYLELTVDMKLLVKSIGYFVLRYPPMEFDSEKEYKSVTAYSCECELEYKDLIGFKINTGETDSLEYLVTYDDDEEESLLSAYTGLPYDYIMFDNTYPEQLSELLNKYEDGSTITDEDEIEDILSYCDLVPRLKSKIVENTYCDEDGDEVTNSVLVEFVEFTYDDDGNVTSIYLFDGHEKDGDDDPRYTDIEFYGFNERISRLINFYTKYHDQLSLIPLATEKCSCNWSVGYIDPSLANKKYQFDVDGENIYSFLTNDVAGVVECVFTFDLFEKKINAVLIENIGEESGVIIQRANLMDTVTISCDEDNVYTRYAVYGADDLGIEYVNFGQARIDDLTYFLNACNEDGKLTYVSDELRAKYYQFAEDRELARQVYMDYTKTYNQLLTDINELKYRVPADVVQTDWDTFTLAELEAALTTYKNLLVSLVSLYKEDYGPEGVTADDEVKEEFIRGTMYWYDYYAYKQALIQIEAAYDAKCNDSTYADIDNEDVKAEIDAWKTEWSLYGTVELQNKIEAYNNQLSVLIDAGSVIPVYPPTADFNGICTTQYSEELKQVGVAADNPGDLEGKIIEISFSFKNSKTDGIYFEFVWDDGSVTTQDPSAAESQKFIWYAGDVYYFTFNSDGTLTRVEDTGEIYMWEQFDEETGEEYEYYLTEEQQLEYMGLHVNYHDTEYVKLLKQRDECQAYLDELLIELDDLQQQLEDVQNSRLPLTELTTIEGYDREALGEIVELPDSDCGNSFTEDEIKTINLLYIDTTYTNENILTTSLDTTVTTVDVEYDLLDDAREQLSIDSQPQIAFESDVNDLLAMPEFKDYKFEIGNYVTVEYYDDYLVTLRLYDMEYNPCIPEDDIKITFTNFVKSRSKRSDLSYILDQATGGGGGHSSGSGGSGGTYGESSDIDVTISNTMLAQLLNSETFGTRVSNIILDTIDVNSLYARTATFGGLANGYTQISGNCIRTGYIISTNYNAVDRDENGNVLDVSMDGDVGSIIDLNNGTFNFGGKKLTAEYDQWLDEYTVSIEGIVVAEEGKIGPWYITEESISKSGENEESSASAWQNPNVGSAYFGDYGISITDQFWVDKTGHLYAKSAEIEGTITAAAGSQIGPWFISEESIYKVSEEWRNETSEAAYFGNDGLSITNNFTVDASGNLIATNADISGKITASGGSIAGWSINNYQIYKNLTLSGDTYQVLMRSENSDGSVSSTTSAFLVQRQNSDSWTAIFRVRMDGSILASKGTIGGFTITDTKMYGGDLGTEANPVNNGVVMQVPNDNNTYVFAAGSPSHSEYKDALFRVKKTGELHAENAEIVGDIEATTLHVRQILYVTDSNGNDAITLRSLSQSVQYTNLYIGEDYNFIYLSASGGILTDSHLSVDDYCTIGDYLAVYGNIDTYKSGACHIDLNNTNSDYPSFGLRITSSSNLGIYSSSMDKWLFRYHFSSDNTNEGIYIGSSDTAFTLYATNAAGQNRPIINTTSDSELRATMVNTHSSGNITVHGYYGGTSTTSNTFASSSSDESLKESIEDTKVNNALEQVLLIRHREFTWKKNGEYKDIGYIAQEVEKINPLMAIKPETDDEYYAIDTFYMESIITKSIQELYNGHVAKNEENIESIKSQLSDALQEIADLKKEIKSLKTE